jgi:ParB family chromosome partitioning protein
LAPLPRRQAAPWGGAVTPPEQQSELDTLTAESDALWQIEGELDEDHQSRLDTITERIDELQDRETAWPAETLAIAGVLITLGSDGKADIRAGYIRPEHTPKKTAKTRTVTQADGTVIETDRPALPASLIESVTAQRTAAINAALLERPGIALAATVHGLALQVFYNGSRHDTALQIMAIDGMPEVEGSPAHRLIQAAGEHWTAQMPADPENLFLWCLAQNGDTLRGLLTFCIAQTQSTRFCSRPTGPTAAAWNMPPAWPRPCSLTWPHGSRRPPRIISAVSASLELSRPCGKRKAQPPPLGPA